MIFWNKSPGKKIIGDRKRFVNICVFRRDASVLWLCHKILHQTRLPNISHIFPLLWHKIGLFLVRRGKVWFLLLSSWSWSSLGASPPWTFYFIAMTCVSQGNNKRTENNQKKWFYKKNWDWKKDEIFAQNIWVLGKRKESCLEAFETIYINNIGNLELNLLMGRKRKGSYLRGFQEI